MGSQCERKTINITVSPNNAVERMKRISIVHPRCRRRRRKETRKRLQFAAVHLGTEGNALVRVKYDGVAFGLVFWGMISGQAFLPCNEKRLFIFISSFGQQCSVDSETTTNI